MEQFYQTNAVKTQLCQYLSKIKNANDKNSLNEILSEINNNDPNNPCHRDPSVCRKLKNYINDKIAILNNRKTLIIITHRLLTLKNCDHIYRIINGEMNRVNILDEIEALNEN